MSDLSKVKFSKITDIKGGQCIVLHPCGTVMDLLCCSLSGEYKNILRFVDACFDRNAYPHLGCSRKRLREIIKKKSTGFIDYCYVGGYHVVTIYTPKNLIVVLSFYNEV